MVLVGTFFGQSALGSHYASGTTLSGTPSAAAASLLQRAVPGQSGDTEQIVFQTKTGTVHAPAVQKQIQTMLGRVSHLPYVSSVTSPYSPPGAKQISASKQIAFATVNFSKDSNQIPAAEATQLVNLARAPNSPTLQVDVVGAIAASTNPTSSQSTLIGVVAALVILLLFFSAVLPALLPLLSTGIALTAGLAVVGMLSNSLSMASFTFQLCTLIGLGVGIDYSLFILTRVRNGLRRGLSVEEAITAAAATAGRAVLFAGITVCIALLGILTVGGQHPVRRGHRRRDRRRVPGDRGPDPAAGPDEPGRQARSHPPSACRPRPGRDRIRRGVTRLGRLGAVRAATPDRPRPRHARDPAGPGRPVLVDAAGNRRLQR